ncbi:hypothetical protein HPB51_016488 [Rhipicephalus microplus]|uniref:Uncharacterized protein n=1 Tax=Rhipicephalus microplus TaxID=6941 RepID=A0A9J6DNC3_RHIMP|nr:hypothetical protein HPB51_016488 [Rhipicephalus microplus]
MMKSHICELHFHAQDFITTLSDQGERTGRIIEVEQEKCKLKHNVVHSFFSSCPKYLSSKPTSRRSPAIKIARKESAALQEATNWSLEYKNFSKKETASLRKRTSRRSCQGSAIIIFGQLMSMMSA